MPDILPSPIHGLGLFANRDLQVSQIVLPLHGRVKNMPDELASKWALKLGENLYLDDEQWQIEDFLNHSEVPNCRVDKLILAVVVIKQISYGEELTIDYRATEDMQYVPTPL
ncbi:MAG: SET domain-containing protein-lysine N-methyltransferase [Nitrososphaerales archaeon]